MPLPVGKRFFDQYSVICVFGSVVGCVVVPLLTQVRTLLSMYRRYIFAAYICLFKSQSVLKGLFLNILGSISIDFEFSWCYNSLYVLCDIESFFGPCVGYRYYNLYGTT